jgi:hypothetical protein
MNIRELRCVPLRFASAREALFQNFRLAGRGSIRRPPHLLDWVHSLRQLAQKAGERDTGIVIRLWNAQCAQTLQIVGRKAMALKNLMEQMPEEGLALVAEMVSEKGWEEGCWTEDALASKRIFPGHVFRVVESKAWSARQTVTKASCVLMLERVRRESRKGLLRGKILEKQIAERAQMAAVVTNIVAEFKKIAPVLPEEAGQWVDLFAEGDPGLDMELRSAVMRHDEKFVPTNLPSLQSILDKHAGRSIGGNQIHQVTEKVRVQATELEESAFHLLQKQVEYDKEAFKCYLSRVSNVERAAYHKKMEWQVQCHQMSQAAAEVWWAKNITLLNAETPGVINAFRDLVVELSKRHSVLAERVVRGRTKGGPWIVGTPTTEHRG